MSSNIELVNNTLNGGFLSEFVESDVEKPTDGRNGKCTVHYSGQQGKYKMKVKLVNGMREGIGTILKEGAPFIQIEYHHGLASGTVCRVDYYGVVEMRGHLVNGMESGLFEEYDRSDKVVWRGYYRDGKRYSEVVKSGQLEGYYDEKSVENGRLLSIAEYDEDLHDKNGRCLEYENGSLRSECEYENGVMKIMIQEFDGSIMTEYNSGRRVYEGGFKGDMKNGFVRDAKGNELDENGVMKRVCVYENGEMKRVVQEFNGGKMVEYDENGKKVYEGGFNGFDRNGNGYCFNVDGKDIQYCLYENGQLKRVIQVFKGNEMTENDVNGKRVYVGGYTGDMKSGFVRNGRGYCINDEIAKQYGEFEQGLMKRVIQEFDGSTMTEYNENGVMSYLGEWRGDMKSGYVKEGKGREYDKDGETALYSGDWKNGEREGFGTEYYDGYALYTGEWKNGMRNGKGKEMDESGKVVFVGEWKNGKRNGMGKEMDDKERVVRSGKWVDGEYQELLVGNKGYNDDSVTELKLSGLARLKRIVIGNDCFRKARVFELDGLSELESVVIGKESFMIDSDERSDGSCRIVNCPKLKSIQIGGSSFWDYQSFELSNLPSLQSIDIGYSCFKYAPSFSLTGLIDGLV